MIFFWLWSCAQAAPPTEFVCVEEVYFEDATGVVAEADVADLTDPLVGQAKNPRIRGAFKLAVDSDYVEWDLKNNAAQFQGHVKAVRDDVTIQSEHLAVTLDQSNQIQTAVATGNVEILSGERKAQAQRAELDVLEGRLILSEAPSVQTPKGVFLGERLLIWLDDDRVKCEGKCRVELREEQ